MLVISGMLAAPTLAGAEGAAVMAKTSATIAPSLSNDRPGARAALTMAIAYAGGEAGVPVPVRRTVVDFPAGMTLDIPHLRACSAARLLARGPAGCPAQSRLGVGQALTVVRMGAVLVREHVVLSAFLGPPRDGWATVQILGQGYTPQQRRMVVTGVMSAASAPFGEELTIPLPPIPTLPGAPDGSLVNFSLTIGRGNANAVLVPSSCPVGGLPFGAQFTYADGSQSVAEAAVPCGGAGATRAVAPRAPASRAAARASRTISFQESGRLSLVGKPHGYTLYERGTASGTAAGSIYVRLTAVSTSRVTAEVNIYARGGSIVGYATANYRTGGTTASFDGSMSVRSGSGSYARVRGSGLSFSGTIERSNDAIAVRVSGRLSD